MGSEMKIERNEKLCHGCRACELMCSFHHHRTFSPEGASIHVERDNANGVVLWSVDDTCDQCRNETQAFCIQYCPYGALKKESS
jgi:anaerobic carbon-monoxide dehydrogenase iron sulfur subunit